MQVLLYIRQQSLNKLIAVQTLQFLIKDLVGQSNYQPVTLHMKL